MISFWCNFFEFKWCLLPGDERQIMVYISVIWDLYIVCPCFSLDFSAMVEKWRFNSSAIVSGSVIVFELASRLLMTVVLDLRPIAIFRTVQVSLMSPRLSSNSG